MDAGNYKYNASDDGLADWLKVFTSRNGDGSGDPEENFLGMLRLVARCLKNGSFLEIGTGLGRIIELIASEAGIVVGLEPDQDRFVSCRDTFRDRKNVQVLQMTTSQFMAENPQRSFDLVSLSMVLQHVSTSSCEKILQDVRTLLAPNGLAVISSTHSLEERFLYQARNVPTTAIEFDRYAENIPDQVWGVPVRLFSGQTFCEAIRRAGMDIVYWNQFCYARPDCIARISGLFGIPAEVFESHAVSQFAVAERMEI